MERERRVFERMRHCLSCELHYEGRKTTGILVDISARGLFVRTNSGAKLPVGTDFRVVLRGADEGDIELVARLARSRVVRPELAIISIGGFGLELVSAPETFYAMLKPLAEG